MDTRTQTTAETYAKRKERVWETLIVFAVTLLTVSNIVSQKFLDIDLFGLRLQMDVGTLLLFSLIYLLGDVPSEVLGFHASRRLIWYGFAANIFMALVFQAAIALPPSRLFDYQEAYAKVLGSVSGLVLASMAGYWCGSFSNDFVLTRLKEWMVGWDPKHRWLPLRLVASTVVGEFFDTAIFVGIATLAFGIFPKAIYFDLVLTQWIVKSAIEFLFFPLTILIIRRLKRYLGMDIVGTQTYNPFALAAEGGTNMYGSSGS